MGTVKGMLIHVCGVQKIVWITHQEVWKQKCKEKNPCDVRLHESSRGFYYKLIGNGRAPMLLLEVVAGDAGDDPGVDERGVGEDEATLVGEVVGNRPSRPTPLDELEDEEAFVEDVTFMVWPAAIRSN